jgi:hypothetical protein
MVRLSALRAGRPSPPPPGRFLVLISVRGWVDPRITVRLEGLGRLKKSNYLIGNRTRNLSTCSIVPQPTTLPRGRITEKTGKDLEGNGRGVMKVLSWNLSGGTEKDHDKPSQDSRYTGRESNRAYPEYVWGIAAMPTRSVRNTWKIWSTCTTPIQADYSGLRQQKHFYPGFESHSRHNVNLHFLCVCCPVHVEPLHWADLLSRESYQMPIRFTFSEVTPNCNCPQASTAKFWELAYLYH